MRALNAAVFDSVMVAVARRLQAGPIKNVASVKEQYDKLLKDNKYVEAITRTTSDEDRVSSRISIANQYISQAK